MKITDKATYLRIALHTLKAWIAAEMTTPPLRSAAMRLCPIFNQGVRKLQVRVHQDIRYAVIDLSHTPQCMNQALACTTRRSARSSMYGCATGHKQQGFRPNAR